MTEPLISLRSASKRFGGIQALSGVSFDVAAGSLHAVVGENGAGKSTLMKIIAGVIPDYEGELLMRGQPARFADTRDAERAGIAIVHQELNLVEQLSAAANVFLGRELRGRLGLLDERRMRSEAAALLAELECRVDPGREVGHLRVGDQQLVEIARALAQRSDVLILDEPTSALSESEVARLDRVIARLRSRGVTILYISHKMSEVFRLADRITVLRDGRLVDTLERGATTPRQVTNLMVGRELAETHLAHNRAPGAAVLEVTGLSLPRADGDGWRLRDIGFALRAGEIVGVAGLMGAGRTELLECLFGASVPPPTGTILLAGRPVRFRHPAQAAAAGLALVSEDRKRLGLFPHLSVAANVTLRTLPRAVVGGIISARREGRLAAEAVDRLRIKTASYAAPILSLSGGNQQKTIIGRWLLAQPKVLLLDDPTRGIDVGAKAEIYRLMDELCRQGLAILVTSSELPELLTVSDRILVLCEGRLTAEFSRVEASEERIMEAATRFARRAG
jgi:ABC-type sugar transport system ATPase subunit